MNAVCKYQSFKIHINPVISMYGFIMFYWTILKEICLSVTYRYIVLGFCFFKSKTFLLNCAEEIHALLIDRLMFITPESQNKHGYKERWLISSTDRLQKLSHKDHILQYCLVRRINTFRGKKNMCLMSVSVLDICLYMNNVVTDELRADLKCSVPIKFVVTIEHPFF